MPVQLRGGDERTARLPSWRREELRTNLWLVPATLVLLAGLLFALTYAFDQAVYNHEIGLPWLIRTSSADAGRQVLIAIAAAVITVVGVVFSVTILALTLASQQFGPRMMRNFVRDRGNQLSLGVWVATFAYAVLSLGSISDHPGNPKGPFVPYISIAVAEALLIIDIAVLIYFIHHVAKSIQLPEVIASIANDLMRAIETQFPDPAVHRQSAQDGVASAVPAGSGAPQRGGGDGGASGDPVDSLVACLEREGVAVPATQSGYLQFVSYSQLIDIASGADAVIRLAHRPGHFVVAGRPMATVWPPQAADKVAHELERTHVTGPHRILIQDPVFAIDQLVEIAIRSLSLSVNDTFTVLTCIDWLSAGLCDLSTRTLAEGIYRDRSGQVRLIELDPSYARGVNRAFDKIRQAGGDMPAVVIRLMDSLAHIMEYTTSPRQRVVLMRQADMILKRAFAQIDEENDLADLRMRYDSVVSTKDRLDAGSLPRNRAVPSPGKGARRARQQVVG